MCDVANRKKKRPLIVENNRPTTVMHCAENFGYAASASADDDDEHHYDNIPPNKCSSIQLSAVDDNGNTYEELHNVTNSTDA